MIGIFKTACMQNCGQTKRERACLWSDSSSTLDQTPQLSYRQLLDFDKTHLSSESADEGVKVITTTVFVHFTAV